MVVDGRRKQSLAALAAARKKEEEEEEQRKKEREKEEYEKYNFTFRAQEDKPEMVQRATRLYNLYSRRAIYAGMDRQAWDDWNKQEEENDKAKAENMSVGQPPRDNASTPVKTVETPVEDGALARAPSPHKVSLRTTFTADAVNPRQRPGSLIATGAQFSRSAHPKLERAVTDGGDFMKELLIRKSKRRRKKKIPIEARLQDFYDKVAELKVEEAAMAADLEDWENSRRWTVLTKGVKAALAYSSDEDDSNPLHTL